MKLSEAIEVYRQYARHELSHSSTTAHGYTSYLRRFARWLTENGQPDPPISSIGVQTLKRYFYSLTGQGHRPRTIRGAFHPIRCLFAYLNSQGAITANPAVEVKMPKLDAAERLLVSDEDLQRLLEAAGRQSTDFRIARDQAVLAVLIFCGLRRQELLELEVQHVNLEQRCLVVQKAKGKKARTIPLCQEAVAYLQEWLALRRTRNVGHSLLFLGQGTRKLGQETLAQLLDEIKAIAGMRGDRRLLPHSFRHACATRLLRNGADLKSVSVWLGHSRLDTTAVYVHSDEEQLRSVVDLASLCKPEPPSPPASAARDVDRHTFFRRRRHARPGR